MWLTEWWNTKTWTKTNIDSYEREKIESTLVDAKHLVEVIENYIAMVKYCDDNGIKSKYLPAEPVVLTWSP
jgi:hypothetical protein